MAGDKPVLSATSDGENIDSRNDSAASALTPADRSVTTLPLIPYAVAPAHRFDGSIEEIEMPHNSQRQAILVDPLELRLRADRRDRQEAGLVEEFTARDPSAELAEFLPLALALARLSARQAVAVADR